MKKKYTTPTLTAEILNCSNIIAMSLDLLDKDTNTMLSKDAFFEEEDEEGFGSY